MQPLSFFALCSFNPQWNDTFAFDVGQPNMAMLRFEVIYKGLGRVALFTSPLESLKLGYHYLWVVPVDKAHTTSLATILIHLDVQTYISDMQGTTGDDAKLSMPRQLQDILEDLAANASPQISSSPNTENAPSDSPQGRREALKKGGSEATGMTIGKFRAKSLAALKKGIDKLNPAQLRNQGNGAIGDSDGSDSQDESGDDAPAQVKDSTGPLVSKGAPDVSASSAEIPKKKIGFREQHRPRRVLLPRDFLPSSPTFFRSMWLILACFLLTCFQ